MDGIVLVDNLDPISIGINLIGKLLNLNRGVFVE
jgi:hypothetical protein